MVAMNNPQPKVRSGDRVVAQNRKARHEYHILQTWEAGIALQGTEVKSLRDGKANLSDAFARLDHRGEMWLHNMHVSPYEQGNRFNHDPLSSWSRYRWQWWRFRPRSPCPPYPRPYPTDIVPRRVLRT